MCQTCETCRENQVMPANTLKFKVKANHPGEIYGVDVADIQGKSHIVCVDYFSCCIFERQLLKSLHSSDVIEALKSILCDIRSSDKLISDNARYFVSKEFKSFVVTWSIHHITLSPRFPHGNAHTEKVVHIVKQIYHKADDVKLALLLLKTIPIANMDEHIQDAPANLFFGREIKAHIPIKCHKMLVHGENATPEVPSKYSIDQDVWIKLDPNAKWVPGKIEQVLPTQSYEVVLRDGHIFRCNKHNVTLKRTGCQVGKSTSCTSIASFTSASTTLQPKIKEKLIA